MKTSGTPQNNRFTTQIDEILDRKYEWAQQPKQIAREMNIRIGRVYHVLSLHGYPSEKRPYRVPDFKGWNFTSDNIDTGRL